MESLELDLISSSLFPIPPRREQYDIAKLVNRETAKIDALGTKIQDGIDRLKEFRTALISAAVTGKIDVRDNVAECNENNARAVVD